MTEEERHEIIRMLVQLRRATVMLCKSIQLGEKLTRDYKNFLYVTNAECIKLEMKLSGVTNACEQDDWPDTNYECWEARK